MKSWWSSISLRGLRVQILLWTILPFIILLIALSLTGIRSHQQSMRALVAERDAGLAQALANSVSAELSRYSTAILLVARSEALQSGDITATRRAVTEASRALPKATLLIMDERGDVVIGPDPPPDWAVEGIRQPSGEADTDDGPTARIAANGRTLLWAIPLKGNTRWLVAGVPLEALELERLLSIEHLGANGTVALIASQGQILYVGGASPADTIPIEWSSVEQALEGENGFHFAPSPEGEQVIAYAPIPEIQGTLLIREPWEPLAAPLLRLDRVMPFVLLTAAAVSVLTLVFGLRYVVRPLQKLDAQADRIGLGDFEAAAEPVGGVKEIEDLRRTLDRMARQVQRYQAALEDYVGAMTRAQEEERARLSRELHDETVQTLIALSQRVQMVQRALKRDPSQAAQRLAELRTMVNDAVEEVRRFSQALRPSYLEELGLVPALEMLAREVGASFRSVGTPRRLTDEQELALYRIAQEALSNVLRHARARHIWIELAFTDAGTSLRVQDDGIGFRVPRRFTDLARSGHFGLMGMYERVQLVGGRLIITSSPGKGTTIEAHLPR